MLLLLSSQTLLRVPKMWKYVPWQRDQSEAPPKSEKWHIISMTFLCSLLRCHFAGKPVMALQNVGCFLRLSAIYNLQLSFFFFLDKVTDAKIDSTFQCRQWLIYQWFHPNIDPTLPGYQWQSMYIGNCTHKRIWEMHGERVIYVACSRHSDGGDRVNLYTASAKKTQGKKWWETGVGVREFSIFCLHPTNNFPCTLGYGDVS